MSDIIKEVLKEDALLREKESQIPPHDIQKVLEVTMERHRLYNRYENIAKTAGDSETTFKISTLRQDVFLQVILYKLKLDVEGDIAKIFSRLDDLETKIQDLGKKQ